MYKKVAVLGGGTGLSALLKGLKLYPLDISAIVSVCDDGASTGKLREEFNIPAVGDIRKVIVSLSETEPLVEELLNYRFNTSSDLNGHAVGNLLLTALKNITGNMTDGITALSKVLNLKGNVIPLTEDNVILMGKMEDNTIVEGEHNITEIDKKIKDVYYKVEPKVTEEALKTIREADCIIFSMGSLYTSIIPNLLCREMIKEIDKSNAKIVYVCNMMTQPGETDDYKVSDHVKTINKYLGKRKIEYVIANIGEINNEIIEKYATLEQKDKVIYDKENLKNMKIKTIVDNFVHIDNEMIRHDNMKLSFYIFSLLTRG
ncbi:MAG TPA: uridine diphosphate-N-acetylglucosamine-binding protein YvcK [Bacilli bacterium]|nr:uridine diphosphate-N-acetylglucosamine-binding protein YvcK [Bacilli bacterium]